MQESRFGRQERRSSAPTLRIIIMGDDEAALLRLWREKRGEVEPEDLSGNLIVQLGPVTEPLNRLWYERNTGQAVKDVQRRVQHPVNRWMAATLDGMVEGTGAVFEAKFMLPWSFSEEAAAEKHMAQLQHNMWVTNAKAAALSIITGGGKWVEITIPADCLYQHLLLTAEKKFWRCVESGEAGPPALVSAIKSMPAISRRRRTAKSLAVIFLRAVGQLGARENMESKSPMIDRGFGPSVLPSSGFLGRTPVWNSAHCL